ncbi:hypothetical protein ACFCZY_12660 [Streptomyces sp. NPDC056237]|uniref:hypothetical protein n=1 Tax=unclassified Streptomyces TaxID=2593676 RepID=UPI0035DE5B5C
MAGAMRSEVLGKAITMIDMIGSLRKMVSPDRKDTRQARSLDEGRRKQRNLFEAAATYVSASVDDDQALVDEASGWVSPEALSFGVSELACRAVIALARERDESPRAVARTLLGLPAD